MAKILDKSYHLLDSVKIIFETSMCAFTTYRIQNEQMDQEYN